MPLLGAERKSSTELLKTERALLGTSKKRELLKKDRGQPK